MYGDILIMDIAIISPIIFIIFPDGPLRVYSTAAEREDDQARAYALSLFDKPEISELLLTFRRSDMDLRLLSL